MSVSAGKQSPRYHVVASIPREMGLVVDEKFIDRYVDLLNVATIVPLDICLVN